MPRVLVAGSERRDDKSKEIYMTVIYANCETSTPPGSNFNRIWHYSFQERIIETNNEISIP